MDDDMLRMLEDDDTFTDVTFEVEGVHIGAHRAVLSARSAYFRTMLRSGCRESQARVPDAQVDVHVDVYVHICVRRVRRPEALDRHVRDRCRRAKESALDDPLAFHLEHQTRHTGTGTGVAQG